MSSKFCRTTESSLCFSLRWSNFLDGNEKFFLAFPRANILFCVLRWLIQELLKSRTEYPLVSALKLSLVLKLWLLLHEISFFFYQPDKDVFFPVAMGVVRQLIEILSAVKLLKKGQDSICIFFLFFLLAIENCWCTWSSCLVPVLIAEEATAIITAWSRPCRANLCSDKLSNESFSFL